MFTGIGSILLRSRKVEEQIHKNAIFEEAKMTPSEKKQREDTRKADHRRVRCFDSDKLPKKIAGKVEYCLDLSWMAQYEVRRGYERYGGTAYFGARQEGKNDGYTPLLAIT